jgi:hypothetical protein
VAPARSRATSKTLESAVKASGHAGWKLAFGQTATAAFETLALSSRSRSSWSLEKTSSFSHGEKSCGIRYSHVRSQALTLVVRTCEQTEFPAEFSKSAHRQHPGRSGRHCRILVRVKRKPTQSLLSGGVFEATLAARVKDRSALARIEQELMYFEAGSVERSQIGDASNDASLGRMIDVHAF